MSNAPAKVPRLSRLQPKPAHTRKRGCRSARFPFASDSPCGEREHDASRRRLAERELPPFSTSLRTPQGGVCAGSWVHVGWSYARPAERFSGRLSSWPFVLDLDPPGMNLVRTSSPVHGATSYESYVREAQMHELTNATCKCTLECPSTKLPTLMNVHAHPS